MSEIVTVINEFNRYLDKREKAQWAEMAVRWRQQEKTLELYIQRLADAIEARRLAGLPIGDTAITHLESYKELLRQVAAESAKYEGYASRLITSEQMVYGETGIAAAQTAIRKSVGAGIRFNMLNTGAIQDMVGITADGSPLFDVLKKRALAPDMVAGLTDKLIEAVTLGYNPRKTATMMADGLSQGLTKALTIARTEQIRVYRQASVDQYIASGVVKQFQRHAAFGERACLSCLALDGQIQDTDELIESHPNCRCFITPVIPGVSNPDRLQGADWLAKQNEETQRTILGSHYDLYQSGVPITDMVSVKQDSVWGPTLGVKPLRDLAEE